MNREYEFKGTPGPWRWEMNPDQRQVQLVGGKVRYDLYVMDFKRWGLQNAQPRFRDVKPENEMFQVMTSSDTYSVIVPGREHHASWFRFLDHPDANLIAAAPDLLQALINIEKWNVQHAIDQYGDATKADTWSCVVEARKAINKALNL